MRLSFPLSFPPRPSLSGALCALLLGAGALTACSSDNSGDAGSGAETRTVATERGDVEVPADPQRVVAVDWQIPPTMIDLGVTPVGIYEGYYEEDAAAARAVPDRYIDALVDATRIGNWDALNLEKVSQLDPDLIVTTGVGLEDDQLDQLAAIAPMALADNSGDLASQAQIADILNRSDEFDELQRTFDDKAAEIAERHRDVLADARFVSVSGGQDANWFAEGGQTAVGTLLSAVGASFADVVDPDGWWGDPRSLENLGDLDDATVILHPETADGEPAPNTVPVLDNPVFRALPAVKAGNSFGFSQGAASNIGWAIDALDEIDRILSEVGEQ
ncbi:MAG: ABC transporter substrate-binding protein [Corynebacterium sp.]